MNDSRVILLTEVHGSVAEVGAAFLLWNAGLRLADISGWAAYAPAAYVLSALSMIVALLPWLWPAIGMAVLRSARIVALIGAAALGLAAMVVLDLSVLAAAQLLLVALALAELPPRPHVIRWLWAVHGLIFVVIVVYYAAVPVRPVPD